MLVVCTLLWEPNALSKGFSSMYDDTWAEKLYNGFLRNLTVPFRFVLYTDRERDIDENIEQIVQPDLGANGYSDCIRPFELGLPMILAGLDTIVVGNCDDLAAFCFESDVIGVPRDPYAPHRSCNGVVLCPAGQTDIYASWSGENDMEHLRRQKHVFLDDALPGQVQSYKGLVKKHGLGDTRICYFHGKEKPHELPHVKWISEHWR